jgi:hypothetical protein
VTDNQKSDDAIVLTQVISALKRLSPEDQQRIIETLITFFKIKELRPIDLTPATGEQFPFPLRSRSKTERVSFSTDLAISPKEFLREKQPRTDVERIACLAYYLTNYRDTPHFKTLDLSKLNTEGAQPKFANAAWAANNALKRGYLVQASKGTRQLSASGEQFVHALPDREAARIAFEGSQPRRAVRKKADETTES